MDSSAIRILVLPGGGTKGYASNRFMQKFVQQWGIGQENIWKNFDVITGTSIGSILGCGYAAGKTPDLMESFFLEKAKRIFTIRSAYDVSTGSHNASSDSNRPNNIQKGYLIGTNDPFYESAYGDSNYGSNILQQVLTENFGTDTLSDLKTYVTVPSFEADTNKFVVFSNFNDQSRFIGQNELVSNVCRASSAAPIYLPSFSMNGHIYRDGGIYANDPALSAIMVAANIKPNARRIVIVDAGTGQGKYGFDGSDTSSGSDHAISVLMSLFDMSMTGSEAWSDFYLKSLFKGLIQDVFYYKFNPKYPDTFPNELDNSEASWFTELAGYVDAHYTSESDKISQIIGFLTA